MGDNNGRGNIPAAGGAAERYKQTYPELTAKEIDRLRRFGAVKKYPQGERLFEAGKITCGMFVVLKGQVCISQRDGLGRVTPVIGQGPGQFLAEVSDGDARKALPSPGGRGQRSAWPRE